MWSFIALCDVYEDRVEETARVLKEMGRVEPKKFSDYREMLKMSRIGRSAYLCLLGNAQ